MTDVKPCPFCGGEAERVGAAVRCAPCGVQIVPRWDALPKTLSADARFDRAALETAARWNRRPTPCAN